MQGALGISTVFMLVVSAVLSDEKCNLQMKGYMDSIKENLIGMKSLLGNKECSKKKDVKSIATITDKEEVVDKEEESITTTSTTTRKPKKKISSEDVCVNFVPVPNIPFNITCLYSDIDLKNGLTLEALKKSKLCTDIIALVKHRYESRPPGELLYLNPEADDANVAKWRPSSKIFIQIGSWNDPKQPTAQTISKSLQMTGTRTKFVNAIVSRLQSGKFDGVLLSWYYPGCPMEDCMIGTATDEIKLVDFLKDLTSSITTNGIKTTLAMEISLKPDHIFLGIYLEAVLRYIDIVFFENTCPEKRVSAAEAKYYKSQNGMHALFGSLHVAASHLSGLAEGPKSKNAARKQRLMELETIIPYVKLVPQTKTFVFENNTAGNLCKLVQSGVLNIQQSNVSQWPYPFMKNNTEEYPFSDYDYIKTKVDLYKNNNTAKLSGVWIRDIWADDTTNECGCGSFPILRAANEAIGRSTCKLPNCPT